MIGRDEDGLGVVDWEEQIATLKASKGRTLELMATIREMYPAYAEQYRTYFDALTAKGFTPEQALEIVKAHGWMPK